MIMNSFKTKLKLSILVIVSSLSFLSCSDFISENNLEEIQNPSDGRNSNKALTLLTKYIEMHDNNGSTRTSHANLIPITINNDTTMFIYNHIDGGWELLSNNTSTPMILASSKEGHLNKEDIQNMPENVRNFINSMSFQIKELSSSNEPLTIDKSWEDVAYSNIVIPDSCYIDSLLNSLPNDEEIVAGDWVAQDTAIYITYSNEIPHLITTHWPQTAPYNKYIKHQNDSTNYLVGCVAVAIGQLLYYLHARFVNNTLYYFPIYSSAEYDSIRNEYSFYDLTTSIWRRMEKQHVHEESTATNYTALLLGYISKSVSTQYASTWTSSTINRACSFLNDSCLVSARYSDFDHDYVINSINNRLPTITFAWESGNYMGHAFIIDACRQKKTTPVVKYDFVDMTGNIVQSKFVVLNTTTTYEIQMNWGYGNSYYDSIWFTANCDWAYADKFNYNARKEIIKIE